MSLEVVPKILYSLPLSEPRADEGMVIALDGNAIVVQFELSDRRLRTYSEASPPTFTLEPEVAADLALCILREVRPSFAAALEVAERRLQMRLVGGPEDAA